MPTSEAEQNRSPLDEIEVALLSIADGVSPRDAVAAVFAVINREREAAICQESVSGPLVERSKAVCAVPTTWLDPLLTGPGAVLTPYQYNCQQIELLLHAIRERIATLPAVSGPPETRDYTQGGRLPTIKEMVGSIHYGGRMVINEDNEPAIQAGAD